MTDQATNEKTVTLSSPVTLNGETFEKLTFREPEVGDLIRAEQAVMGMEGGEQTMIAATLAAMCGMPFDAFRKIKVRDLKRIMAETRDFLGNGDLASSAAGESSQS